LTGWLESMLPLVKEEGSGIAVDGETFELGLAAAVKDNDSWFPPDWRMSYKGRAQPS
jgi:enoyl-CoA hydratase